MMAEIKILTLDRREDGWGDQEGVLLVNGRKVSFYWNRAHQCWVIDTQYLGRGEYRGGYTVFPEVGVTSREIFCFLEEE